MTEELGLWTVSESGEVEQLSPIQQMSTELALEEALVRNPEMLGPGLKLVGRQTRTQTGWLDLLAVDGDGRLVVYELKRGTVAREAVAQVLDYASDLDAMSIADLAKHIAERSGNDKIKGIDEFEQWYAENFGGADLSRLLPPRMVLIGLGIDPVAERMARFMSGGPVNMSVLTFHGFKRGGERLLARQLEVDAGQRESGHRGRSPNVDERRRALREYLVRSGHKDLFDRVHADLSGPLPESGVWEEPRSTGISFQLNEPDDRRAYRTYFGVSAGYRGSACSVSILPQAIHRGEKPLERLRESVNLSDWPHGGYAFSFASEEEWAKLRPALVEFVNAVIANRSGAVEMGT